MYTLEEIQMSILNGQRVQALEQLKESPSTLGELFTYLQVSGMSDEVERITNLATTKGMLTGVLVEGK